MATFQAPVFAFNSALGVNLDVASLNANTFALNAISDPFTGTFSDDDGLLGPNDSGTTTFNGDPVNFIGSGTMQFGASVGGGGGGGLLGGIGDILGGVTDAVFDIVSDPADVTVFEAGGQVYLILPDGPPETLLGLDSVLVSFSLTNDPGMIPCFASGTLIRTPEGDLPIEDLEAGAEVLDEHGRTHEILWAGARTMHFHGPRVQLEKLRPVRIKRNAFGPGQPFLDLVVSPQHRIAVSAPGLELVAGVERGFAAAKHLLGDVAYMDRQITRIRYHHILCAEHVVLVANGLPAESLFLGPTILEHGFDDRALQEIETLFPEVVLGHASAMKPALPFLKRCEVVAGLAP